MNERGDSMAIVKSGPLTIGSGSVASGDSSTCHGLDVSTYASVGIDVQISTGATSGSVYVKIYGLNSTDYSGNKFEIITYEMTLSNRYQHFSIPTLDFLHLCVSIVNATDASVDYTIDVVGAKVL